MNNQFKDEKITTYSREKKVNLLFSYKDKFVIKFKKLHSLKTQKEKKSLSKLFNEASSIKDSKIKTPIIKLDQIKLNNKLKNENNINIINNKKFYNYLGLKNNSSKKPDNSFLFKVRENKYLSPINQNNNKKELMKSSSYTNIKQKNLLENSNTKRLEHIHNISYNKDISENNDSINNNRNKVLNLLNKSNSQKSFNIRQKFFFHRNKNQKLFFNKSFQNIINKSDKNINFNNKNHSLNSVSIKELNPNISNNDDNSNLKFKKLHCYDLRLKELLDKNNKNNETKEKDNELIKQQRSQKLALFFDNLPSLIMKKNIEKNLTSRHKKVDTEDFGQNYYSSKTFIKKEENRKNEIDKIMQNYPIVKYIFLQKILNSLVHKVKLFRENKEKLIINSNTMIKLNEEIKDFITYGYEFIPEEFLKYKDLESARDLLKDQEFINLLIQTKSSIDSTVNNNTKNTKTITQIKPGFGFYIDTGIQMHFNSAKEEIAGLNIIKKFMEQENKRSKISKKSRFLYKRIPLNKTSIYNNKVLLNKSTNYDYSTINNNNNKNTLEKSQNMNKITKVKNNLNNDDDLLSQILNILYDDIYNLDNIIKKNKKEKEKRNFNTYRENFWKRLLRNNNKDEIVYYTPEISRRIKSGKEKYKKIRDILNINYEFDPIERRRIKSCKQYLEIGINENEDLFQKDNLINTSKNIQQRKFEFSPVNLYYQNNFKKTIRIKNVKKFINFIKKPEKTYKKYENIQENNDIFEPKYENKEKYSSIASNFFFKRRKSHIKSLKKYRNSKKEYDLLENKKIEEEVKEVPKENIEEKPEENPEEKEEEKEEEDIEEKSEESSKENKKDIEQDKKDDNYYTNSNMENNLYKKREEPEINQVNKIIFPKEKKKKPIHNILIHNIKDLFKEKEESDNNEDEKVEEPIQFFKGMEGKSLEEIEKKKIELLYKFKHDIIYKISIGEINEDEMDNFIRFKEKINKLKKIYNEYDLKQYIKEMEIFFQSLKEEIENNQRKKVEEDRINNYLTYYRRNYDSKLGYKELHGKLLCKVINYNQVNHLNILNDSQ